MRICPEFFHYLRSGFTSKQKGRSFYSAALCLARPTENYVQKALRDAALKRRTSTLETLKKQVPPLRHRNGGSFRDDEEEEDGSFASTQVEGQTGLKGAAPSVTREWRSMCRICRQYQRPIPQENRSRNADLVPANPQDWRLECA